MTAQIFRKKILLLLKKLIIILGKKNCQDLRALQDNNLRIYNSSNSKPKQSNKPSTLHDGLEGSLQHQEALQHENHDHKHASSQELCSCTPTPPFPVIQVPMNQFPWNFISPITKGSIESKLKVQHAVRKWLSL
jgi:hypothetical protein